MDDGIQTPLARNCGFSDGVTMLAKLSVREREVMLLVANGLTNKEIANQLELSEATVKVHLQSIFRKLAIRKRTLLALMVAKIEAS
jgi:DNA-binding NarL/FixJ family response regulator